MSGGKNLTELNPHWHTIDGVYNNQPIAIVFDCPIDGPVHKIFVPFVDKVWNAPRPVWVKEGETFENLSLSPSIFYDKSPCKFHGWVKAGVVRW